MWKKQLEEYVLPPMDPAIDEALLEYIAKRKAESPDSNV
jgi:trimethylamine---corrinoid protein Co-methyltransferase